jgi:hypothetical protein
MCELNSVLEKGNSFWAKGTIWCEKNWVDSTPSCHSGVLAAFGILACPHEGEQPVPVAMMLAESHLAIYRWVN